MTAVVVPECEKATATSPSPRSAADISIMCASSKTLVRTPIRRNLWLDVTGDLRRAADAVEVALARIEDQVSRLLERFRVEDRKRFLEGMDGGAEHLLRDLDAGVVGRQLLMKIGGRQAVVVDDAGCGNP